MVEFCWVIWVVGVFVYYDEYVGIWVVVFFFVWLMCMEDMLNYIDFRYFFLWGFVYGDVENFGYFCIGNVLEVVFGFVGELID